MASKKDEEKFYKAYEANQRGNEVEYNKISGHLTTEEEVREALQHFIDLRKELRDEELSVLQEEAREHLIKLKKIEYAEINERIRCFRDIVKLHKMLIKNDKP